MDWAQYWFMLPVSTAVATTAMLSGIGGAAMFIPIFLVAFPLADCNLLFTPPAVAAIGVALLTETFGFSSGFVGYYRRGLIDFRTSVPFLTVSVPVAVGGALIAFLLTRDNPSAETVLKAAYGVLMLLLAAVMAFHHPGPGRAPDSAPGASDESWRELVDRRGKVFRYRVPTQGRGVLATGLGGLLTGLLGVGIGEVIMPQLAQRNRIPLPVAAATSVLIVIVTVAAASLTLIYQLVDAGGVSAVPWHLVCYTVPGVILGGQIGPRLHGRISTRALQRGISLLFLAIGLAMLWLVATPPEC